MNYVCYFVSHNLVAKCCELTQYWYLYLYLHAKYWYWYWYLLVEYRYLIHHTRLFSSMLIYEL